MAFSHGMHGAVFINGLDARPYLTSFNVQRSIDAAEVSTFAVNDKAYIPGMRGATVSLEGFFDGSADAIDEVINGLVGGNSAYVACLVNGDALGSVGYATPSSCPTSYEPATQVGGAAAVSAEVQVDGVLDPVVSLHAMAAETGASDAETSLDQSASSSDGARAHLHFASTDGSIVVKVQHSADNSAWADLITFAAATGRTVEVVEVTGTVNRYVRASWARTGGTTGTFLVAFRRL